MSSSAKEPWYAPVKSFPVFGAIHGTMKSTMTVGTKRYGVLHGIGAAISELKHMMDLEIWLAIRSFERSLLSAHFALPARFDQDPCLDQRVSRVDSSGSHSALCRNLFAGGTF